jgi:hypothetical protein
MAIATLLNGEVAQMADDEALQALEGRIAALENALAGKTQSRVADLTDDEIAAFKKVQDVIAADYGDFCGINDCYRCRLCTVCSVCQICRVCRVCIFECSCGPCNIGGGGIGNVGGFNQFGG